MLWNHAGAPHDRRHRLQSLLCKVTEHDVKLADRTATPHFPPVSGRVAGSLPRCLGHNLGIQQRRLDRTPVLHHLKHDIRRIAESTVTCQAAWSKPQSRRPSRCQKCWSKLRLRRSICVVPTRRSSPTLPAICQQRLKKPRHGWTFCRSALNLSAVESEP